jgi:hypothetical protein
MQTIGGGWRDNAEFRFMTLSPKQNQSIMNL